jgi:[protein-PII] uridylyltransferase
MSGSTPRFPSDPAAATLLLRERLVALTTENGGVLPRDVALGVFRRHLARFQAQLRTAFESGEITGMVAARRLAALNDGLIAALFAYAQSLQPPPQTPGDEAERMALAATGGYGRGVLAPFSDIDLLFLTAHEPSARTLRTVEFMLYFLWDLGLKIGHATRSVAECLSEAGGDLTILTSLLDARLIAGDDDLFALFHNRFFAACAESGAAGFISAKQAERTARHHRFGESPFLVEPNIKEGRGGLRDLQTLHWIARYAFGIADIGELANPEGPAGPLLVEPEVRLARRSWDFLWTVRFHLHYVSDRAEERLTFDLQPVVGARMGYTPHGRQDGVERFMRHYFLTAREVARLTTVLEPALVRAVLGPPARPLQTDVQLFDAGFILADSKLMSAKGHEFYKEPLQMLRILQVSRDRSLALHPLAMRALIRHERRAVELRDSPEAAALFLDLLCGKGGGENGRPDGAVWLKVLNETGILGRLLPDWARIVGQMQFDTYHVFTVDEHTIEAIRVLNTLEVGDLSEIAPIASELVSNLQSRRALYVALLLHDIAKGRGGDHSELGADLALGVGPQLGLSAEETETASWLVLHHLLLSQTAFRRDIDDPKTILDIAEVIQSPERLRLLLVLTVADMRAVSPKVWNGWKATLLRELYARVAEVLAGGLSTAERDVRVDRARQAVALLLDDWPREAREQFLALGYGGYWLGFDPETHARHARMIRDAEARKAPLTVQLQPLPTRAVTEVTVYAADHAGLFSQIAGALAVAGASIVDARIHTLTNGMALDTFWVQDTGGGTFDSPQRLSRLYGLIEQALAGRLKLTTEIRKISKALLGRRVRAIHVPPRVVVDNHASNTHTVLEVNGRDRPGLLHDITAAISEQGLQIASAHVSTYGVRAVDVFYVKDVFGLKVENERKLQQLREALLEALASPDDAPPPPPTQRRRALGIG